MKRFLTLLLAAVIGLSAGARQTTRDLDITVELQQDGSAWITQIWDAYSNEGTEWYIPIGNLGPMTVSDLSVSENGVAFESLGDGWDVDWSRSRKTGKCGIVRKRDGVELCWGIGEYADHRWVVRYKVTGLVQSLQDADAFNFMFVAPGMDASPEHVRVVMRPAFDAPELTYDNTRVWLFGSESDINLRSGSIVAESTEPFEYRSSLIALVKFEKGIFSPTFQRDMPFQTMLDTALEGSSYGEDDDETFFLIGFALLTLGSLAFLIFAAIASALGYKYRKSFFGKSKITEWYRDIPVEGNLNAAYYVLEAGKRFIGQGTPENLIGAYFLRWILSGDVQVEPDPNSSKRVNLKFINKEGYTGEVEDSLFRMALTASGANEVLEKNEFENWSKKNYQKVTNWPSRAKSAGKSWFSGKGWLKPGDKTTEEGAREASHVIEFKNFLNDFTLSKERGAVEVGLWKDYLVFAQLFGIAEKVAKQFKKLYPAEFQELSRSTGADLMNTIYMSNYLSTRSFTGAAAKAGSVSGRGGHGSFGGGGGFSGGGFGGGAR